MPIKVKFTPVPVDKSERESTAASTNCKCLISLEGNDAEIGTLAAELRIYFTSLGIPVDKIYTKSGAGQILIAIDGVLERNVFLQLQRRLNASNHVSDTGNIFSFSQVLIRTGFDEAAWDAANAYISDFNTAPPVESWAAWAARLAGTAGNIASLFATSLFTSTPPGSPPSPPTTTPQITITPIEKDKTKVGDTTYSDFEGVVIDVTNFPRDQGRDIFLILNRLPPFKYWEEPPSSGNYKIAVHGISAANVQELLASTTFAAQTNVARIPSTTPDEWNKYHALIEQARIYKEGRSTPVYVGVTSTRNQVIRIFDADIAALEAIYRAGPPSASSLIDELSRRASESGLGSALHSDTGHYWEINFGPPSATGGDPLESAHNILGVLFEAPQEADLMAFNVRLASRTPLPPPPLTLVLALGDSLPDITIQYDVTAENLADVAKYGPDAVSRLNRKRVDLINALKAAVASDNKLKPAQKNDIKLLLQIDLALAKQKMHAEPANPVHQAQAQQILQIVQLLDGKLTDAHDIQVASDNLLLRLKQPDYLDNPALDLTDFLDDLTATLTPTSAAAGAGLGGKGKQGEKGHWEPLHINLFEYSSKNVLMQMGEAFFKWLMLWPFQSIVHLVIRLVEPFVGLALSILNTAAAIGLKILAVGLGTVATIGTLGMWWPKMTMLHDLANDRLRLAEEQSTTLAMIYRPLNAVGRSVLFLGSTAIARVTGSQLFADYAKDNYDLMKDNADVRRWYTQYFKENDGFKWLRCGPSIVFRYLDIAVDTAFVGGAHAVASVGNLLTGNLDEAARHRKGLVNTIGALFGRAITETVDGLIDPSRAVMSEAPSTSSFNNLKGFYDNWLFPFADKAFGKDSYFSKKHFLPYDLLMSNAMPEGPNNYFVMQNPINYTKHYAGMALDAFWRKRALPAASYVGSAATVGVIGSVVTAGTAVVVTPVVAGIGTAAVVLLLTSALSLTASVLYGIGRGLETAFNFIRPGFLNFFRNMRANNELDGLITRAINADRVATAADLRHADADVLHAQAEYRLVSPDRTWFEKRRVWFDRATTAFFGVRAAALQRAATAAVATRDGYIGAINGLIRNRIDALYDGIGIKVSGDTNWEAFFDTYRAALQSIEDRYTATNDPDKLRAIVEALKTLEDRVRIDYEGAPAAARTGFTVAPTGTASTPAPSVRARLASAMSTVRRRAPEATARVAVETPPPTPIHTPTPVAPATPTPVRRPSSADVAPAGVRDTSFEVVSATPASRVRFPDSRALALRTRAAAGRRLTRMYDTISTVNLGWIQRSRAAQGLEITQPSGGGAAPGRPSSSTSMDV